MRRQPARVDLVARRVLAQRRDVRAGHPLVLHPQGVDHVRLLEPLERVAHVAMQRLDPRGMSVGGPQTVTSQPIRVNARMFERATRLCSTSPTIHTFSPSSEPRRRLSVNRSSSACVGGSCFPSPALITEAAVQRATSAAAPAYGERMTMAAGS